MEKKKYVFRKEFNEWLEEREPLRYSKVNDGIAVYGGSLVGSGFVPYGNGITLPGEIDGLPVTELNGCFESKELDYIETVGLKRAFLKIVSLKRKRSYSSQKNELNDDSLQSLINVLMEKGSDSDEIRCHSPHIYGSSEGLKYMEIVYEAGIMHLDSFRGCSYLYKVFFNGKVKDDIDWEYGAFERGIFQDCLNLQEVYGTFEGYTTSGSIFENCISLTHAPKIKVKRLLNRDFYNCVRLPLVHLSNGLQYIGTETFAQCHSLKDIYIPDTVNEFGEYVFRDCKNLETIHLPDGLNRINKGIFYGCVSLNKVFLPDDIEVIDEEAFMGCSMLSSPWIPKNLRKIGARAFKGCLRMKRIFIPEMVTSIGEQAFEGCPELVIVCAEGSVAHQYASANKIAIEVRK